MHAPREKEARPAPSAEGRVAVRIESGPALLLGVAVLALMAANVFLQLQLNQKLAEQRALQQAAPALQPSAQQGTRPAPSAALLEKIIPRGTPERYGKELAVSFEKPVEGLKVLAKLDGDLYPDGKIKFSDLSEAQQKRYLEIGASIACEFCCGAKTLVSDSGRPACGCAHSAAMRGLAKYLLASHEDAYSNQQILEELTKWKTLFFPKQMVQRAARLQASSPSDLAGASEELPDMVGGC